VAAPPCSESRSLQSQRLTLLSGELAMRAPNNRNMGGPPTYPRTLIKHAPHKRVSNVNSLCQTQGNRRACSTALSLFGNKFLTNTREIKPLSYCYSLITIAGRVGRATVAPSIVPRRRPGGSRRTIGRSTSIWWWVRCVARIYWRCWRVRSWWWAWGSSFCHEILQVKGQIS